MKRSKLTEQQIAPGEIGQPRALRSRNVPAKLDDDADSHRCSRLSLIFDATAPT